MTKRATNRAASINVQRIDETKCTTKRVLIPSTVGLLRKSIKLAFKTEEQITSLKTENGMDIISIHDILPDSMVYVSFTKKTEEFKSEVKVYNTKTGLSVNPTPTSKPSKTPKSALKKESSLGIPKPIKHIKITESQEEGNKGKSINIQSPSNLHVNKLGSKTPDRIPKPKETIKTHDNKNEGKCDDINKVSKSPIQTPNQSRKSFIPVPKSLQSKKQNMITSKHEEFIDSESDQSDIGAEPENCEEIIESSHEKNEIENVDEKVEEVIPQNEVVTETEIQINEMPENTYNEEEKSPNAEEEEEEEERDEKSIFVSMFEPSIAKAIDSTMNAIATKEKEFISEVFNAEQKQISWWLTEMQSIVNSEIADSTNSNYAHVDELVSSAKSFVENHKIQIGSGFIHNFQAALLGEGKSGKSTYLSILSREILLNLATSGEWKNTFIIPINMGSICINKTNDSEIYNADPDILFTRIVKHTMKLAAIQSPFLRFDIKRIEEAFCRVVTKSPMARLPSHILQDTPLAHVLPAIQNLIEKYYHTYRDLTQLHMWIDTTIAFPVIFSRILGFERAIWLIDDTDLCDYEIMPSEENHIFELSTLNRNVSEALKVVIELSPYIITGKDTDKLQNILPQTSEYTANNYTNTEFIPICDFVQNPRKLAPIVVSLNELKQPVSVTTQACCGIPAFLSQLYQLHSLIDDRDQLEEGSYDREELDAEIETFAEEVVSNLFAFETSISVKSVTRNKESN